MMFQNKPNFLIKYFPAMTSGVLLTLSFPNNEFYFIAFFALIPFFSSLGSMTVKESFNSGLFTGIIHYFTLIYWIVPTVHVYGKLHIVLAISTLAFLCSYLALYPALFALIYKKTDPGPYIAPLFAASLWVGLEYIRTYAFTGFSWGALGYSQYSNLLLVQIADFSGVYGVTFLIVLTNFVLSLLYLKMKHNRKDKLFIHILYTLILLGGTVFYGYKKINIIHSSMETAKQATISVIQGNIKQDQKWSDAFKKQTVEKYIRLSEKAARHKPDLIIWPETALPFYYGVDKRLSDQVDKCIRSTKSNYLIGSPAFTSSEQDIRFFNRAYMLNRFSIVTGTYDKHHLVPFGEYVPLGNYLTFLGKITAQAGNFSPGGTLFNPLEFNDHQTGVLICFEILFPSIAAEFVKNGADLLTTITNDAWFGYTSAAKQHFSIAVFRAIESRRTVARAANTGISGFIDPKGNVLAATPLFTDQAITQKIPALKQISFYTRYGDMFAFGAIVAICLVFVIKGARTIFWSNA